MGYQRGFRGGGRWRFGIFVRMGKEARMVLSGHRTARLVEVHGSQQVARDEVARAFARRVWYAYQ